MSTLQTVLAIIGGLFALAALAGGLYVAARASVRDAQMSRLRVENEDLIRRLDWIEPRHRQVEEQNRLLMQLHNPTERLDAMGTKQDQTLALLNEQSRLLQEIDEKLDDRGPHHGG